MDGKQLGDMPINALATIDGYSQIGMTLRQHFAGLAMQGLLAQAGGSALRSECSIGAEYAVEMADALLIELAKDPT